MQELGDDTFDEEGAEGEEEEEFCEDTFAVKGTVIFFRQRS